MSIVNIDEKENVNATSDTELPASAALNGTWPKTTSTTISGAALMVNDGTNAVLVTGTAALGPKVDLSTRIRGEDESYDVMKVEQQYDYTNITTSTTTTVKSGATLLHGITINKPVVAANITCYDNTAGSGAIIAKITLGAAVTGADCKTLLYDVKLTTGLTIVTDQATDITVSTRT